MQNSKIEWTDHTFNPWWGCIKVSPGCEHCYAETWAKRYGHDVWGSAKTTPRRMISETYWKQPIKWNKAAENAGQRKRVFCASMADVFEDHPQLAEPRARLLQLIHDTPWLDWLLLTKRPEGWSDRLHEVGRQTHHDGADMLASQWLDGDAPANVWMGTSVENQEQAERRIPYLLKVPASVRFLSCEPLLGAVDLEPFLQYPPFHESYKMTFGDNEWRGIDWVICGGESGPGARPMHPDWARSLRDQCVEADVPYFFKQWGEWAPDCLCDTPKPHNDIPRPQPGKLGVMFHCGKHAAGRLLDGRTWDEFPESVEEAES
jgi:protein gp37